MSDRMSLGHKITNRISSFNGVLLLVFLGVVVLLAVAIIEGKFTNNHGFLIGAFALGMGILVSIALNAVNKW